MAKSSRSAGAQPGYCPACFALIDATIDRCPACGLDIARLGARDCRDKLLAALLHPLAEVRMRAIISIGWRRESEAAPLLVDCALRHPADVVEGLQVVESLGAMRDSRPGEQALRTLVATHPARAVRSAAQRKLGH